MKLTIEKVKSCSLDELYLILLPNINNLYSEHSYLEIEKQEYKKIVLFSLRKSLDEIDNINFKDLNVYFIEKIKKEIKTYLTQKIKNENNILSIISNFIDLKMDFRKEEGQEKELEKLNNFLNEFSIQLTPYICFKILKEKERIKKIIEMIVDVNSKTIKNHKIDYITPNNNILTLIDAYFYIYGIKKINYDEDQDLNLKDSEYAKNGLYTYLTEIDSNLLPSEADKIIENKVLQGYEKARNILIEQNLKLVVFIAKRYIGNGLELEELIQEGNVGLIVAANKFDMTKNIKFSTFAFFLIRQYIEMAIEKKSTNIKFSSTLIRKNSKYIKAKGKLTQELYREPSIEEIARELNVSEGIIKYLSLLNSGTISINTLIGDEKNSHEIGDLIRAPGNNPEEEAIISSLNDEVNKILNKCNLTEKEIKVLKLKYGFDNKQSLYLQQIGDILGVSGERVRQIEAIAINKIRCSRAIKELAVYMDNPDQALKNIKLYREECWSDIKNRTRLLTEEKTRKKEIK